MVTDDRFPSEKIEQKTSQDLAFEIDRELGLERRQKDRFSSDKNSEDLFVKIYRVQARENRKTVVGIVSVVISAVVFLLIKLL